MGKSGWSKGACPATRWGVGERSWAEAGVAEPMANPAAVTTAAVISEVINSFLLFKIRAFESGHVNLIVSPSKMALTLMRQRCDPSRKQSKSYANAPPARIPSR
jgi:hypothetical protein